MASDTEARTGSLGAAAYTVGGWFVAAWRSPLKKYIFYSLIIHIVLIGVLSAQTVVQGAKQLMGIESQKTADVSEDGAAEKPDTADTGTPEKPKDQGPPDIEDAGAPEDATPSIEDLLNVD